MEDPNPPFVTLEEDIATSPTGEASSSSAPGPTDSTTEETVPTVVVPTTPRRTDWKSNHENDTKSKYGHRDLVGYGAVPVKPHWPRSAKVALNFVINYEEGAEMCTLHGDHSSEHLLSDIPGATPWAEQRNLNMESMYEYGSRSGFWRLHRIFTSRKVPVTVYACGMALERNIEAAGAMKEANWEIASHGYRWWDYTNIDEETEREHIQRTIEIHEHLFGKRPVGFYQGKPSPNTRKLVVEDGGFLYDSDAYNDDLPYWTMEHSQRPHLIIPYTLTENDMIFTAANGISSPDDFCSMLKKHLDFLITEGRAGQPKMMTVGLHCRLSRPARAAAIAEFVDYAKSYGREVWICTREAIANHWYENHLPRGVGNPIDSDAFTTAAASKNRLAFLGNLSTPRGELSPSSTPKDGDVI